MSGRYLRARAMLVTASVVALIVSAPAYAAPEGAASATTQSAKPTKKKRAAKPAMTQQQASAILNARAQAGPRGNQQLDEITVAASKMSERAIDALAPVSVVTLEEIKKRQASTVGALIYDVPGVWLQDRGDDPSTSINIRGLQDFGRVAVVVDGARQNYQRTGHNGNGSFFLNPELIGGVDIVRGPTANIYGSGAIGGVASFRTKDIQDVVRIGERWGVEANTVLGTNHGRALGSLFGGVHINPNVDFFAGGTYSTQDNYKDGTDFTVANTGNRLSSGIAKLTVRPADGHEVKLGTVFQENLFSFGQPARTPGQPNTLPQPPMAGPVNGGTSIYATDVKNYTTTLGWTYSKPDDKLFDWNAKIYWNRTENDQIKTANTSTTPNPTVCGAGIPGNPVTGCVGSNRGYLLDTFGFDVYNTSRFETGDFRHALTYGGDGFRDDVTTRDATGNSNVTTPGGIRTVTGAFAQLKTNYTSILEVVSALRYDNYHLESGSTSTSGDRLSPKITVGLLPTSVVTPYVSYAEGYRAPSITETVVTGSHISATTNDAFFTCANQAPGTFSTFCFLPNPNLRPEVGKTKEIGFNVKKDGIFTAGDSFRAKFNVFRNDVDDYIELTPSAPQPLDNPGGTRPPVASKFFQYQNIAAARIQGFEAETMYDAVSWFVGVSATIQEGKNVQTGFGLYSIAPQKITTSAGVRFADNKAQFSVMWTNVQGNNNIDRTRFLPSTSYDLVNLYLSVKPTENLTLTGSVENALNKYYRPYAIPLGSAGDSQNDTKWASAAAGIVFKGGLRYHFGGI